MTTRASRGTGTWQLTWRTLPRHQGRPLGAIVPDANPREWHCADDLLPRVEQQLVLEDWFAQYAAEQIISSVLPDETAAT